MAFLDPRRRATAAVATAIVIGALLAATWSPAPAGADAGAERRRELREAIQEASREEAGLIDELATLDGERERLDEELADLASQAEEAAALLAEAEAHLEETTAEAVAYERRLDVATEELEEAIEVLQDQAVVAFVAGLSPDSAAPGDGLDMEMNTAHLQEVGAVRAYADAVAVHQRSVVRRVTTLRDEVGVLAGRAERARREASEARAEADDRRRDVAAARRVAVDLRDEADIAAEAHDVLLAEVRARRSTYELELAAATTLSSGIATMLAERQAGQVVLPAERGMLALPVSAARMTSGFGYRVHPIYGTRRLHAGIDLAAPSGTPIRAAADGVVVGAARYGGYGNTVIIDHGSGLATLYAHQSRMAVVAGQQVRRGDVVGQVGSTGSSTGPHLHFETRIKGTPVDPLAYL